ncbi:MAG: aminotransferase class I/II-fold pyridoxal phosphate-dependent enzyme [Thermodesulfobacteriota bacterium]
MMHGHGGNIFRAALSLGCPPRDICDMSSNINPLGPVPGLLEHLAEHVADAVSLPDVDAEEARRAFGRCRGLRPENLAAGNGTTELIYLIPRALGIRKALVFTPTYADYADALRQQGARVRTLTGERSRSFVPDPGRAAEAAQDADAVFVCNPSNPTGVLIPPGDLEDLAVRAPRTLFVVDESYLGFAEPEQAASLANRNLPNVLTLISLSKIFGIPGLRAGFCHGPEKAAQKLRDLSPPWSVNTLAQEAILFLSSRHREAELHEQRTRAFLDREREAFSRGLAGRADIRLYPGRTSFVLGELCCGTGAALCAHLLQKKILIRDCANFSGLTESFFRVSLKSPAQNALVRDHILAWLEERKGAQSIPGHPPRQRP